jgi:RNA polymerase sigma-70 factor (ECF subfamily)
MTLDELYDEHESILYGYALRLTRDADRADDLVQDALVRAMGHLGLLAMLARPQQQAWLFRTLKNLFLDEEQKHRRQAELLQEIANESLFQGIPAQAEVMDDPFEQVPERFRNVVEMHYRWGMTSQEIATRLEIPAATVRSRLHLALKEMRRKWHQLERKQ